MEGGLASSWHSFHLSAVQLLLADLEISLCASLANSVDGLMLYNTEVLQCRDACVPVTLSCSIKVATSNVRSLPVEEAEYPARLDGPPRKRYFPASPRLRDALKSTTWELKQPRAPFQDLPES